MKRVPSILASLGGCGLLACSNDITSSSRSATPEVHSVQVSATTSCPQTFSVEVGAGRGACDTPLPPVVTRSGNDVTVRLTVQRPGTGCIDRLDFYAVTVPLGSDFAPGDHTVTVVGANQLSASFTASCR
jgi:hypothetical protein